MVHLHTHSEYSLRDSTVRIDRLVDRVSNLRMTAIALTDHGNVAGWLEFIVACKTQEIKPILGMEAYFVSDMSVKDKEEKRYHGTLIALSPTGCANLITLATRANTDGFYYQPRIDYSLLFDHSEGLILLTGCINSVLYMQGEYDTTEMILKAFCDCLPVFLEVMPHDIKEQRKHNLLMAELSKKYSVPMVATQDVHYIQPEDVEAHDVLMKIQERSPYGVDSFYLTSSKEMMRMFLMFHKSFDKRAMVQAITETDEIADMVEDYNIPIGIFEFPEFVRGDE